jgi:hypothetical protein
MHPLAVQGLEFRASHLLSRYSITLYFYKSVRKQCFQRTDRFFYFFIFVVLGLELRAYTLSHSTSSFS